MFRWPRLIISLFFAALAVTGCAYPTPFDNGLYGPEAPVYPERKLVLIFEKEGSFNPIVGARAKIEVAPPARLISPSQGTGVTDVDGTLALTIAPVAQYDQSALLAGDIAVDYPISITVTMEREGRELSWELNDNQSFVRYRDPLYQGVNRDPAKEPAFMTLTLP